MTPKEYGILQAFPMDDWKQVVSDSQAYKQFGNAVTTTVFTAIAEEIAKSIYAAEESEEQNMEAENKNFIGMSEPEEFEDLLKIYNRYPLEELIVHPRLQKDLYKNTPNLDVFAMAAEESRNPLCYNGDICNAEDMKRLRERFPKLDCVMVGRGVLADPALGRVLKGGGQAEKAELRKFHDLLYRAYCEEMSGDRTVLYKMKELWFYFSGLFTNGKKYYKKIKKCERCVIYESIVNELFMKEEVIHG